jgi:catechol 2,3-dioxygenase-like lactoylglutathione lyase family enzyme
MEYKIEVVIIPVTDIDRAKDFYEHKAGFHIDVDHSAGEDFRIVQITPPGSACSLTLMRNPEAAGHVQGLHLVVPDIDAARADLAGRGVEVSEVWHDAGGVFHHAGAAGRVPGPAEGHSSYGSWVSFSDPDGNSWFVQEVTTRLPGRPISALAAYDSVAGLADALRRAAAAHGKHEKEIGRADPDWPDWYARYMANELAGEGATR